jgi:hypothetical protein
MRLFPFGPQASDVGKKHRLISVTMPILIFVRIDTSQLYLILNPNVLISLNMTHTKINTYINSI